MPKKYPAAIYLAVSASLFILCVLIVVLWGASPLVRGFMGDILVMGLIYNFLRALYDFPRLILSFSVLGLAWGIELIQLLHLGERGGWSAHPVVRIILGSTFDPLDLLAYTLGMALFYILDRAMYRPAKKIDRQGSID